MPRRKPTPSAHDDIHVVVPPIPLVRARRRSRQAPHADWALNLVAHSHDAVRIDLKILFQALNTLSRRRERLLPANLRCLFAWLDSFEAFTITALKTEEETILPWIEQWGRLDGPLCTAKRISIKGKIIRALRDATACCAALNTVTRSQTLNCLPPVKSFSNNPSLSNFPATFYTGNSSQPSTTPSSSASSFASSPSPPRFPLTMPPQTPTGGQVLSGQESHSSSPHMLQRDTCEHPNSHHSPCTNAVGCPRCAHFELGHRQTSGGCRRYSANNLRKGYSLFSSRARRRRLFPFHRASNEHDYVHNSQHTTSGAGDERDGADKKRGRRFLRPTAFSRRKSDPVVTESTSSPPHKSPAGTSAISRAHRGIRTPTSGLLAGSSPSRSHNLSQSYYRPLHANVDAITDDGLAESRLLSSSPQEVLRKLVRHLQTMSRYLLGYFDMQERYLPVVIEGLYEYDDIRACGIERRMFRALCKSGRKHEAAMLMLRACTSIVDEREWICSALNPIERLFLPFWRRRFTSDRESLLEGFLHDGGDAVENASSDNCNLRVVREGSAVRTSDLSTRNADDSVVGVCGHRSFVRGCEDCRQPATDVDGSNSSCRRRKLPNPMSSERMQGPKSEQLGRQPFGDHVAVKEHVQDVMLVKTDSPAYLSATHIGSTSALAMATPPRSPMDMPSCHSLSASWLLVSELGNKLVDTHSSSSSSSSSLSFTES